MCKYKKILITFLVYILTFLLICLVGITNTFALTYDNVEGYKNDITIVLVAPDYSDSPINVPINSGYALAEVREVIIQVNNFNFIANRNYQLEMYFPQQDLGRANFYTVQGNNGEACIISYDNSAFDGEYPRWAFQCPTATNNITIDIKNSSNQILWDRTQNGAPVFTWAYSYLRYSSTSLTGNGIASDDIINNQNQNTQNIINNQNQNTQNIINNQNQNTQDIIDNQNQNTQDLIDSNKVCKTIDKNSIISNGYINSSGNVGSSNTYGVTDYLKIKSSDVKVLNSYSAYYFCFYDVNKTKLSCTQSNSVSDHDPIDVPENSEYIRFTINKSVNKPQYEICTNGNQALDNTLNDDDTSEATSQASDFFSSFDTDTFGLTSIITSPLNLIQSVLSSSCTELNLPLPYLDNKYLKLPCMSSIYSQYFGSFFTIYQTITYGIVAYWVVVRIFNMVKDFKNPEHDEIEVMDL